MTLRQRSLSIAVVHVALVAMLGGKLLVDRHFLPRGWARVVAYDPELPIRGRYVRLTLIVPAADSASAISLRGSGWPRLEVVGDRVVTGTGTEDARQPVHAIQLRGDSVLVLREPVAFFIPDGVPDPSIRPAGEALWAEVTIPRRGPPRPIRLGVSTGDGPVVPLEISGQ
jgi:hypothetical protein